MSDNFPHILQLECPKAGSEPKAMWIQAHTDFRDIDDADNFYLISSA